MRLAIVGASARAAAMSALDAGYQVVAADMFADTDLASRCPTTQIEDWPSGIERWLRQQQVDAWLYTGGLENYPALVERLAKLHQLLGTDRLALRKCRSTEQLAEIFSATGVPFPATQTTAPSSSDAWLVKNALSAGGLGVSNLKSGALVEKPAYFQQRVEGRSISATYVAADNRSKLLGITEQLIARSWTHAGQYQYAGSVGPLNVDNPTGSQLIAAGNAIARECGVVGLFGIDFVLDPAGEAWAVDVNPRYTASMEVVDRFAEINSISMHVNACVAGQLAADQIDSTTNHCGQDFYGKAYVFARRDFRVGSLPTSGIADIPAPGTFIPKGQPVCTLFANAKQYSDVEPALQYKLLKLEELLYPGEP